MGSEQPARSTVERIEHILTAPLAGLDLDVEAVELTPAGKRRVLRIAIDTDGGVTLDDVASATKVIDNILEADGPEGGAAIMGATPYTLEVTSRGVERPLTLPRHWRRNKGRLVKILRQVGDQGVELVGRIGPGDDDAVTIEVSATTSERVPYVEITRALVQIEFNRKSQVAAPDGADDNDDDNDNKDA